MRKVSRSWAIFPITRKPLEVRKMVYSSLNSGAPLDSIHGMKKKPRSCPLAVSATLRKRGAPPAPDQNTIRSAN